MKSVLWIFLGVLYLALSPSRVLAQWIDLTDSEEGSRDCGTALGAAQTFVDILPFRGASSSGFDTGQLELGNWSGQQIAAGTASCNPFNGSFLRYVADIYNVDANAGDTITLEVNSPGASWGILNLNASEDFSGMETFYECPQDPLFGTPSFFDHKFVDLASCTGFSNGTEFALADPSSGFSALLLYTSSGALQSITDTSPDGAVTVLYGTPTPEPSYGLLLVLALAILGFTHRAVSRGFRRKTILAETNCE